MCSMSYYNIVQLDTLVYGSLIYVDGVSTFLGKKILDGDLVFCGGHIYTFLFYSYSPIFGMPILL